MHLFTSDDFTGELKDCDEGTLEWVPIGDLEKLSLWEGDMIFLRKLINGDPFFTLRLVYEGDKLVESCFL